MKLEKWIEQQKRIFNLKARAIEGGNQFVSREWIITDPKGHGLELRLSENSLGDVSLLTTPLFRFARFNVAEGFSSDFILNVSAKIIKGDFVVERSPFLRRPLIQFKDEASRNVALGIVSLKDYATKRDIEQMIKRAQDGYTRH